MRLTMPMWQRLLATIVVMLIAGYLAGWGWQTIFGFPLPGYGAGLVGGLAALPIWELLKRTKRR